MKFDSKQAHYLAGLARLDPNHPALAHIVDDMQSILAMVETMNSVDTSNVEPLRHPLELASATREDKVTEQNKRDQLLANAPSSQDGFFLVPQIIE